MVENKKGPAKVIPGVPGLKPVFSHRQPLAAGPGFSIAAGLPGLKYTVTTVFATPEGPLGPPEGLPGKYKAVVTLQRPGFSLTPEWSASFELGLVGDSHLAMVAPAFVPPNLPSATELEVDILVEETGVTYALRALANERGFLQKVVLAEFHALNFADANTVVHKLVGMLLSQLSLQLDVPLRVSQIDLTEIKTGTASVTLTNPFLETPLLVAPQFGSEEFRSYASIYREGLGTDSPLYQFLCFYKIVEGIRGRRTRRSRAAKAGKAVPPSPPLEVVPLDPQDFVPWLQTIFQVSPQWDELRLIAIFLPEVVGRAFSDLLGKEKPLTSLRNKISHSLTGASADEVVDLDHAAIHAQAQRLLPILKCITRKMLRNEFANEFLPHLKA